MGAVEAVLSYHLALLLGAFIGVGDGEILLWVLMKGERASVSRVNHISGFCCKVCTLSIRSLGMKSDFVLKTDLNERFPVEKGKGKRREEGKRLRLCDGKGANGDRSCKPYAWSLRRLNGRTCNATGLAV